MTVPVSQITEVLARADYEINEWSGCDGSRWDLLPQPARNAAINRFAPVAERIATALNLTEVLALRDRHREERWPSGTGSNCAECNGRRFPCPTRQALDRWVSEWTPAEEQR